MLKKTLTVFAVVVVMSLLISCGGSGESGGMPADAALKVTGSVSKEVGWTEAEVKEMDTTEAEYTNKKGETDTYTGVPITTLVDKAGANSDANTLTFVADDGYSVDVPLADMEACSNCIVAFNDEGGFRTVLPDFPGNVQVKGVIEIQVK